MTELIYCADGNPRFAKIAIEQGFTYGAQLPNSVAFPPQFVDQNWRDPNREAYMKALVEYKPRLATVLDWERDEQLSEVLSWAEEAAGHVSEAVIIIPKVMGGIPQIPETIGGKPVRLGYSVPTSFAGTELPLWEFGQRPVHLLGGNPKRQLEISRYLNTQSADSNYAVLIAQHGKHWTLQREIKWQVWVDDGLYHAFRLSCINIKAAWNGCRAYIRYGTEADIPAIKAIANQHKRELGFVNSAALHTAMNRYEVYVAEYMGQVVGFVNWHKRRDQWSTVYEVAVHKGYAGQSIGRTLVEAVPAPRRLKCTQDNPANGFYECLGMELVRTEQGRKRPLNVWELAA